MTGFPLKTQLQYLYGDSFSGLEVIWQDSDGVVIDLTGFLASMQVKDSAGVVLLHLDSYSDSDSDAQGGLTIVEDEGKVVVNASAPQMTGGLLVPGEIYNYDIQVKSADENTVRTLMYGKFSVHEQITDV